MKTKVRNIVTANNFDSHKLKVSSTVNNRAVTINYDSTQFLLSTDTLLVPYGIEHIHGQSYGILTLKLDNDSNIHKTFQKLDKIGRFIAAKFSEELFGTELSNDDVSYSNLLVKSESDIYLKLLIPYDSETNLPKIPFFNRKSQKIKNPSAEISNKFTTKLLLVLKGIGISGDQARWQISVSQAMILDHSSLPEGCIITDNEEEALAVFRQLHQKDYVFVVNECDPEHNELLD